MEESREPAERGAHAADRISGMFADGAAPVEAREAVRQSLAGVGIRLRGLRQEQNRTLDEVAELAGMSTRTLSRLETGKRKPSLELLPLVGVYGLPLGELVGTPLIGDPRIHISPRKFHDQTILPLSRGAIGVQAFKHIVDGRQTPKLGALKTHPGFEWVYVIRGRLTLILGDRTMILSAGEAAEFDTRTPHWFGGADDDGVEYLSLFGPEGQRVHMKS
ncbi:transcriptional regulator, XRE family with cupin sensor [Brevibacterium linens]|uniref:Transcriptional regulator, XRE family with cupin sensor n=2 Tax=Brevibacterium linens TaxID=1703 RepID=A0A2H1K1W5_BRELN|nr:transcriptional regulator, XRE family with cupin sensor [Brevibacterium linens]